MEIRQPAVAGRFYPGDPRSLEIMLQGFLRDTAGLSDAAPPKAVIVPHAGFLYSGPVAASAYACVAALRGEVERVVLIGPAHRVAFAGVAVPGADAFTSPLGTLTLDRAALDRVLELPQVILHDAAHAHEHSLEVQLPFLQHVLGACRLVPLVVGAATPEEVAEVLECLWGGPETLLVVSSDLSHYEDQATARERDARTSRAIEALDARRLGHADACGCIPVQGLLLAAGRHGLSARTVDLRTSGDTVGPRDSVVGYGAYVFS